MRYRLLANYEGAPFEAGVGPEENGVVLFAACPPPEDLGFEPATGHWRKQVDRADVQTLYESRPVGTFRGERCVVLDDLSDRLHIAYLGHDAYRAEQLGYWEVDRGVFELITPRQEVTEIVEQRLPVAPPAQDASPPHPEPAPQRPPGQGGEQANGSRPHLPPPEMLSGPERLAAGRQASDDDLRGFPQYSGSAAAADGPAPAPAADDLPLPLEAEAMRAARKAKKDQPAQPAAEAPGLASEPAPHAGPQPGPQPGPRPQPGPQPGPQPTPQPGPHPGPQPEPQLGPQPGPLPASLPAPSASAGLSEPSGMQPSAADSAVSVPSWSPQSPEAAQRPSPAGPTGGTDQQTRSDQGPAGEQTAQPPAAGDAVPDHVTPQAIRPQTAVPQHVASEPAVPPRPAPPVVDDAAIHGVPLPAPAGPAALAAPGHAPPGQAPASDAMPSAGSAPPGDDPSAPVSLQRATTTPPARVAPPLAVSAQGRMQPTSTPAQSAPAAPGPAVGGPISNPPEGGDEPQAARDLAGAGGQVNGMYHRGHATADTPQQGQGLPRDRFERPIPGPALAGPLPAPSGYPGPATAAAPPGGAAGQAGAGVAVADPVLTVPYAPAASAAQPAVNPAATPEPRSEPAEPAGAGEEPVSRRRRASRRRLPTQRIFSDLAAQAGIPASAYAINEDVDGAMCLVGTSEGFEVFNSLAGARHEVRIFHDEESAYFYLFGVLAAEAVRTGVLSPAQ